MCLYRTAAVAAVHKLWEHRRIYCMLSHIVARRYKDRCNLILLRAPFSTPTNTILWSAVNEIKACPFSLTSLPGLQNVTSHSAPVLLLSVDSNFCETLLSLPKDFIIVPFVIPFPTCILFPSFRLCIFVSVISSRYNSCSKHSISSSWHHLGNISIYNSI